MFLACRHSVPIVTGVIYVVIIALWAAVLIPIWLKRHDQISEVRSTARFSSAMSTLGRRGQERPSSDARLHRGHDSRRHDDRGDSMSRVDQGYADRSFDRGEGMDRDYERELARRTAATRRAIVLGSLTALLLLALVLAIVGVLPQWVPILVAVPVVAFILATAMTASSRSSAAPRTQRRAAPLRPVAAPAPVVQEQDDDWETWNAWDDDDAWDAVPATLPTYVSAPRATAVPREIDRAHAGEWTGEAMVETARAMRVRPTADPLPTYEDVDHAAQTAEIPVVTYDTARAVNQ